jgi:hypothetical protein
MIVGERNSIPRARLPRFNTQYRTLHEERVVRTESYTET